MGVTRRVLLAQGAGLIAAVTGKMTWAQAAAVPPVKSIRTNILEIGYHESGNPKGFPVLMLHGFPDDAHAYDGVAPIVAKAGYRAIAVYLRGYGPTKFLDTAGPRMAEGARLMLQCLRDKAA